MRALPKSRYLPRDSVGLVTFQIYLICCLLMLSILDKSKILLSDKDVHIAIVEVEESDYSRVGWYLSLVSKFVTSVAGNDCSRQWKGMEVNLIPAQNTHFRYWRMNISFQCMLTKQCVTHYLPLDGFHIPNLSSLGNLGTKPNYFPKR